jgi:hypothetical protein
MWKNIVEPGSPQMDTLGYKHTLSYVTLTAFPIQKYLHEAPHCHVTPNLPAFFPFSGLPARFLQAL